METTTDFWVECNVCKTHLKNWTGSTPCCGSLANIVENGEATTKVSLYTSTKDWVIQPTVIDFARTQIAEPAIIQSSFEFENGRRITIFTSGGQISSYECNENWGVYPKPFAECPLSWSGQTAKEYHLELRNKIHKPEHFVSHNSTPL